MPDAREAARAKADWRRVAVSSAKIELLGKGARVTLHGIARGFAADRAMDALRPTDLSAIIKRKHADARGDLRFKAEESGIGCRVARRACRSLRHAGEARRWARLPLPKARRLFLRPWSE